MRTLIEIDENTLNEVLNLTGVKSKKNAILIAINDYLKMKKRKAFKQLIGNYELDLTLDSLEKGRNDK